MPPVPHPTNPFEVLVDASTVVTPELEASIRFYRDVIGYDRISRGILGATPLSGYDLEGRRFAWLRITGREGGAIRLIEAAPACSPNRPMDAGMRDPGLVCMVAIARDHQASWAAVQGAGLRTISSPRYYEVRGVVPMNGMTAEETANNIRLCSYCGFGPSGEAFYISADLSVDGKPWPLAGTGSHSPMFLGCVCTTDRWPLWDFYEACFGLKSIKEAVVQDAGLNTAMGVAPGTFFHYGSLGRGVALEWWEDRSARPPGRLHPTSLDRTGLAMLTLSVSDLAAVRQRIFATPFEVVAEVALSADDATPVPGLIVRGAVGELIEVVGRRVT